MSAWQGFPTYVREREGLQQLRVVADYGGTDDDPTPLAILIESAASPDRSMDMVQLTEADILWLRDEVIPGVLAKMTAAREASA